MKIPEHIDTRRDGQYCIECFAEAVARTIRDGKTYYECSHCGSIQDRILLIDHTVRWYLDEEHNYWHESVGVVVMYGSKILCIMRRLFPFSYSLPAGHIDAGERPDQAAERELREETGIAKASLELIATFDLPGDSCRRGSDHHHWNLYRARLDVMPELHISDEVSGVKWLSVSEITALENAAYPLKWIAANLSDKLRAAADSQLQV